MSYRPICDTWILARSKVKYYGAFPAGFLHRARHVLGVHYNHPVLFVCGGKVREYPYRGFGKFDKTLDLDASLNPDFLQDARDPFPLYNCGYADCLDCTDGNFETGVVGHLWSGVLIDRPYTPEDAEHYVPGPSVLPTANELVRNAIKVLPIGGRVGILDYIWPQPPKNATEQALITVVTGRNNRIRAYTVFEKLTSD